MDTYSGSNWEGNEQLAETNKKKKYKYFMHVQLDPKYWNLEKNKLPTVQAPKLIIQCSIQNSRQYSWQLGSVTYSDDSPTKEQGGFQ